MITLYSFSRDAISFDEVLKECATVFEGTGTALVYGPRDCVFARFNPEGKLAFSPDRPWPEAEPEFEARIFSQSAELRWLHQSGGIGRAALLTEDHSLLERLSMWQEQGKLQTMEPLSAGDDQDVRYLLWGTGTGETVGEGWSRLAEPRIGALDVPIADVGKGQHAFLVAREYIVAETDSGNAEVAEERLMTVEVGHE